MTFIVTFFFLLVALFGIFAFLSHGPQPDDMDEFQYAGFWQRFGAYGLDIFLVTTCSFVTTLIYGLITVGAGKELPTAEPDPMSSFLSLFLYLTYFAVFESSELKATPGKLAMGIQVVDRSGQGISLGRAYLRFFCCFFNYLTFTFGYLLAGVTRQKVALHDVLAKTLVIQAPQSKRTRQASNIRTGKLSGETAEPEQDMQPKYNPRF
jgi:uncharacterized RDD family membrane protein YckC